MCGFLHVIGHKAVGDSISQNSHADGKEPSSGSQMSNNISEENLAEDVLNLGQDLGMYNVEGQRIVQVEDAGYQTGMDNCDRLFFLFCLKLLFVRQKWVLAYEFSDLQFAMILRNLSFETDNMALLGSNSMVLRWVVSMTCSNLCLVQCFSTVQECAREHFITSNYALCKIGACVVGFCCCVFTANTARWNSWVWTPWATSAYEWVLSFIIVLEHSDLQTWLTHLYLPAV